VHPGLRLAVTHRLLFLAPARYSAYVSFIAQGATPVNYVISAGFSKARNPPTCRSYSRPRFEFALNLQTAKALGLDVPPMMPKLLTCAGKSKACRMKFCICVARVRGGCRRRATSQSCRRVSLHPLPIRRASLPHPHPHRRQGRRRFIVRASGRGRLGTTAAVAVAVRVWVRSLVASTAASTNAWHSTRP
jgi:hypothetical protein